MNAKTSTSEVRRSRYDVYNWLSPLSLLGSLSTLVCCALPAVLVSLGLGATLVGLVGTFPGLVWLSENKILVFGGAGVLLSLNGFLLWRGKNAPCPTDPRLREICIVTRRRGLWWYFLSLGLYATGAIFAFILPWLT